MAERGREQQGGEFSDFDRWHVCNLARCRHHCDFSGSEMDLCPPLRIRSPTMAQAQTTTKAFQCRYRAPLEKPSKPLGTKHKIYMPLIVSDRRVSVHAIEE